MGITLMDRACNTEPFVLNYWNWRPLVGIATRSSCWTDGSVLPRMAPRGATSLPRRFTNVVSCSHTLNSSNVSSSTSISPRCAE